MKKTKTDPDMLPEYDFRGGVRGKYAKRYAAGSNVVVLSPELAKVFPDSNAVNAALGMVVKLTQQIKGSKHAR